MRFRAGIQNVNVFSKLTASLSSLGNVAWVRLSEKDVRFTVVPEQGSQVWAVLQIDTIFDETFTIQSAASENSINLEVPLQPLHRALKSAQNAIGASIRLTKKDNIPLLSLTITTSVLSSAPAVPSGSFADDGRGTGNGDFDGFGGTQSFREESLDSTFNRAERDTIVTQDIPIRVLAPASVQGLHEPVCREPDVHIILPSLIQLKNISDRFTKLAVSGSGKSASGFRGSASKTQKLELSANMHGCLRLSLKDDAMNISSTWTGLNNPELDPASVQGGEEGIATHPSTRMKRFGDADGISDEGWATVRVDGKDWGRVLGVGRLGGRVIACFCHENALILYVYLANDHEETESVLTYYVSSYSA
ncbi:Hus1-like protein [Myriangium duriaei CBS 260.36]|uniref:Checkpoint protein n=1 Tax=Myriangium duriaei CBS 260.36 TaxID=1168546 RepID=A0A9P4MNI8_9PEZI|nr:Hus1-like protein [Myriangium duriaei CBS 260.36]